MLVWGTTVLEYSFDICLCLGLLYLQAWSGPVWCEEEAHTIQTKIRALTKAGLHGDMVLCVSDMILTFCVSSTELLG